MTDAQLSRAIAKTLKASFPALGTNRGMNGADTIETLCEVYDEARKGALRVPGYEPPVANAARAMAAKRWANATDADRQQAREAGRLGGRPRKKR
jgi:hypothetical protein